MLTAQQELQSAKSASLEAYSTNTGKVIGVCNYSLCKPSIASIAGLGKARLNLFK